MATDPTDTSDLGRDFLAEARRQLAASTATIHHSLGQLDDGQVWWRPREDMNSVGNLLLHLAGNLRQRVLSDIGGAPNDRDRLAEFTERGPIPKAEVLRRFEDAVGRADATLAGMAPEQLLETRRYNVVAGPVEGTVQALVLNVLTHLAGHAQEILHLTRLQLGERFAFRNPAGVPPSMRGAPR
jgi:hypothetical protein